MILELTINMRLRQGSTIQQNNEIKEFADWILKVGNGELSEPNDGEVEIAIPDDLLITASNDPLNDIIDSVYPSYLLRLYEENYFQDRSILAPTHETVNRVNDLMLETLPGVEWVYMSTICQSDLNPNMSPDTICQSDLNPNMSPKIYSPDFLNKIKISGLPNHELHLKEGVPVMLLINVDQQRGLCNGIRFSN